MKGAANYQQASESVAPVPVDKFIPNPGRWLGPKVHRIKRHVDLGNITLSTSAITTGGFSFQLSDIPSYTELQALFDLYRIDGVEVSFFSNFTIIGGVVAPARYCTVIDQNSSNGFASFNDAREFETAHVDLVTNPDTRRIVPTFLTGLENDSAATVYGGASRGWLNTSVANVPHYGYRYIFEAFTGAGSPEVRCEAIYYLSLKATK